MSAKAVRQQSSDFDLKSYLHDRTESVNRALDRFLVTFDRGRKTIIGDSLGLDFVNKLKPIAYRWTKDDGVLHYGLGAQDVMAVAPEGAFVNGTEETHYGMNYSEFIAPLIKSVQELKAENERLKARLEALEAKVK